MADLYFWRQFFILSTGLFNAVCVGFLLSFPSVLNPALLAPDTTDIRATPNQASWLAAVNGFTGMIGFLVLSPIMQIYGRKVVHICTNIPLIVGWVIFSLANSMEALFAARICQGFAMGSIYINSMIISEYSDAKRRGYFVIIKKVALAFGILMCHSSSLFWGWRQIAAFAAMLPTIALVMTYFWPESPHYLALKGRFEESEKSFVWLHGGSNMKELHLLLSSQINRSSTEAWYKPLFRKHFLKPCLIVAILTLLMNLCGKFYITVYVIQIMVELLGDKSLAIYSSMGVDLVTIGALTTSVFFIRRFKRRTILFSFGITIVVLMLIICLVIMLKVSDILGPALILLHNLLVNVGLIPVCFAIVSEVFPLEQKGCGSCVTGIAFTSLYTVSVKFTPVLLDNTGVEGMYGVYGVCIAVCLIVLYFIVPETKDRTLQDIENEFKGIKYDSDIKDEKI
ncbi:facilitated trehalose transporter Tret1-like [Anticarsia gemmatalis]|uniref:facilitated trehalose transporter Tret1-like n=1 Tax=Anticarsia gemmatalis TaxID=129554 RepID=UPI003F774067